MSPRIPIPTPFGRGLDRATGPYTVDPAAVIDVRNVTFREDRWAVRPGLGDPVATLADLEVVEIVMFRALAIGVKVTWDTTTGAIALYACDLQGANDTKIDDWDTLTTGALTPPRFLAAESQGLLFLAHDEPDVTKRLATVYTDGTNVTVLQANLDGSGTADVLFRGVTTYLEYLWGWGFGTDSDPDRPEVVRVSLPGNPTTFRNVHYELIGVRGEAVLSMGVTEAGAVIQKERETYRQLGTNRTDFDVEVVDRLFGIAAARTALTVGGTRYFWSNAGPRATTGGVSADLALPLDLPQPLATDLPTGGEVAHAWAEYHPDTRDLWWGFPDFAAGQTLVYVLSLRPSAAAPRWGYHVYPRALTCCRALHTSTETTLIAPGTAGSVTFAGSVGASSASATVGWTNASLVGDETGEVWVLPPSGSWQLSTNVSPTGTTQSAVITTGLSGSGSYSVAVRFKRHGLYAAGYEGNDPTTWPAGSRATGTILVIPAPLWGTPTWTYTGSQTEAGLTWTGSSSATAELQRKVRQGPFTALPSSETGFTALASLGAAVNAYTDSHAGTSAAGYWHDYRVRYLQDGVAGPWSATKAVWLGPQIAPTYTVSLYPRWFGTGSSGYEWGFTSEGTQDGTRLYENAGGSLYELALSGNAAATTLTKNPPLHAFCSGSAFCTVYLVLAHTKTLNGITFVGTPLLANTTKPCP